MTTRIDRRFAELKAEGRAGLVTFTMAGDPDRAFAALDAALDRDDPVLLLLPHLPHLDRLRNDPRFASALTRARPVR